MCPSLDFGCFPVSMLFNLLHAKVSYIIDIHCHFFSNIKCFNYFLEHQNPDFFSIFKLPIFAKPYRQTYVNQCRGCLLS